MVTLHEIDGGAQKNRGNAPTSRNTRNPSKPIHNFRSETRDRVLDEFNRSTLDDVGPLGGKQGVRVLPEMNELEAGHDEFVKSLAARSNFQ